MSKGNNTDNLDNLLRPGEAKQLLRVDPRTLRRMAERGEVEAIKLPSGHRRYTRESVLALLKRAA